LDRKQRLWFPETAAALLVVMRVAPLLYRQLLFCKVLGCIGAFGSPLFVSAFRRSDELAMAMESRCYHGGEGRTRMRELQLRIGDLVAALAMAVAITVVILWQGFFI